MSQIEVGRLMRYRSFYEKARHVYETHPGVSESMSFTISVPGAHDQILQITVTNWGTNVRPSVTMTCNLTERSNTEDSLVTFHGDIRTFMDSCAAELNKHGIMVPAYRAREEAWGEDPYSKKPNPLKTIPSNYGEW